MLRASACRMLVALGLGLLERRDDLGEHPLALPRVGQQAVEDGGEPGMLEVGAEHVAGADGVGGQRLAVQPHGGAGDGGLAQVEARPAAVDARPHHDEARLGAADRLHGGLGLPALPGRGEGVRVGHRERAHPPLPGGDVVAAGGLGRERL